MHLKYKSTFQNNDYLTFLEDRLADSHLENRRLLLKYQEMRTFAYGQLDQILK